MLLYWRERLQRRDSEVGKNLGARSFLTGDANIVTGKMVPDMGFGSVRHSRGDVLIFSLLNQIRGLVWIEVKRCQLVARRKREGSLNTYLDFLSYGIESFRRVSIPTIHMIIFGWQVCQRRKLCQGK